VPLEAMIEREPITVILTAKGWVRALKGHQEDLSKLDFKQGDSLKFALHAQTTDRLLVFATSCCRTILLYLFGRYLDAVEAARSGEQCEEGALGFLYVPELFFP
jgi:DNA gyrase/topoisomerase IV subunit A